ncbi:MAG: hypothetical protein Q8O06_11020, partial [Acetobacterium sp.]|nr:hypothetical protein [Acetobacterium sp.]
MNALILTLLMMAAVFFLVLLLLYGLTAEQRQMQKRFDTMTSQGNFDLASITKVKKNRNKSDHKVLKKIENDLAMSGILIRQS